MLGLGESGGDLDLPKKSVASQGCRQVGMNHPEGDAAVEGDVLGEVDRGHPAAAELTLDR